MQGRGAKGSVKDRLIQNRFIRYFKRKKAKKELFKEQMRKKQLLEDKKRLEDVYVKEESIIPKNIKLIKKGFIKKKTVIHLPKKLPMLVEVIYEKKIVGIGPDKQTLQRQKNEQKKIKEKINNLEIKVKELKEELIIKEKKECKEKLISIINEKENLKKEYNNLFIKYPFLKDKKELQDESMIDKIKEIEFLISELQILKPKENHQVEQTKSVSNIISENETIILENSELKDGKENLKIDTSKKTKLLLNPLIIANDLNFKLYKDKLNIIKNKENNLLEMIEKQLVDIKNIEYKIENVKIKVQNKEKKLNGLFGFLKNIFMHIFHPFPSKRKEYVYIQMKDINHNIRKMRKKICPENNIKLYYKNYEKGLKQKEKSLEDINLLMIDSLEELYQLKKEFQNDFSDDLEKEECKIFLDSLNELEMYLKNKYLELNTIQNNLNDLIVKNNDKVKRLENYSNK